MAYIILDSVSMTKNSLLDEDEDECGRISNDDQSSSEPEQADFEQEPEDNLKGNKWMVLRIENGKPIYIHISQAIKMLLPREYIARCRQKRHWALKFLRGKEPLNPEHDTCDLLQENVH